MPRQVDPNSQVELWLESDEHLPAESRPTFVFRVMSMRDWRKAAKEDKHYLETAFSIVEAACVGWKNMPGEFASDKLQDVLEPMEGLELFEKLSVSKADKKKSE